MSPGQTGHITGQMGRVPGTDGTHTRGCPAKILYVYWFFSFPNSIAERTNKDKNGRTGPDRETPPFETHPRLAALDSLDAQIAISQSQRFHVAVRSRDLKSQSVLCKVAAESPLNLLGPAPLQKCVGDFCCINLEDFAGVFPGGFFWPLFPTKMRRKNPATKSAKISGGPKIKIREKSVLPKSEPNKSAENERRNRN